MLILRNLAEVFIRARAVGLAEQRRRGIYGQYSSRPGGRVSRNAIKRASPHHSPPSFNGAREMERRRRQAAAGQLQFHSYGKRS